jgi:hypothetical protein
MVGLSGHIPKLLVTWGLSTSEREEECEARNARKREEIRMGGENSFLGGVDLKDCFMVLRSTSRGYESPCIFREVVLLLFL